MSSFKVQNLTVLQAWLSDLEVKQQPNNNNNDRARKVLQNLQQRLFNILLNEPRMVNLCDWIRDQACRVSIELPPAEKTRLPQPW